MCSKNCVNIVDLDYVVLKLNGNDITSMSSYDAVQMFLQAKETLVVELSRKKINNIRCMSTREQDDKGSGEKLSSKLYDSSTTDRAICASRNQINSTTLPTIPMIPISANEIVLTLRTPFDMDPSMDIVEPITVESRATQTIENIFDIKTNIDGHNKDIVKTIADHFIEQQHHLFEQCLEPEIDIEEVTLVKPDSIGDEIGITVCSNGFFNTTHSNSTASDQDPDFDPLTMTNVCEDVFVKNIQVESIADRDGRLKRGDQILRVNDIDIKNKAHAESQITGSSMKVTFLVSRILYPEDDDDEDDDDEDDEDDIDSNFEYANRFLTDDYTNVVDKLDKVLLAHRESIKPSNELISDIEILPNLQPTTNTNKHPISPVAQNNTENIKAKCHTTNTEIGNDPMKLSAQCNSNNSILQSDVSPNSGQVIVKNMSCKTVTTKPSPRRNGTGNEQSKYDYDESEHIYETIPEDSESEPLYCSPYQSSNYMTAMGSCSSASADVIEMQQQTQRVAQWLGLKSQSSPQVRSVHTLSCGRPSLNTKQKQTRISNRVCTLRSAITNTTSGSSSSGAGYNSYNIGGYINNRITTANNESQNANQNLEEVDNSSSAYNTGGSNNSASPRQNPLNLDCESQATCAHSRVMLSGSFKCTTSSSSTKDCALITSPINSVLMLPFGKTRQLLLQVPPLHSENPTQNKTYPEEMPPFNGGLSKTDIKLIRPKPTEEQQSLCPQFNAPNLSRYHFVSSQEVANKSLCVSKPNSILVHSENVSEEIPMVWKVKRRPDGTRYIVKRPVRNHVHVGIRKNIRNNEITTTEDDTISEVKIGRYWTKEERKRHIERARERRHHQQQQQQQQQ